MTSIEAKRKHGTVMLSFAEDRMTVEDAVNPVTILRSQVIEGFKLSDGLDPEELKNAAQAAASFHRRESIRYSAGTCENYKFFEARHRKIAQELSEIGHAAAALVRMKARNLGKPRVPDVSPKQALGYEINSRD